MLLCVYSWRRLLRLCLLLRRARNVMHVKNSWPRNSCTVVDELALAGRGHAVFSGRRKKNVIVRDTAECAL